MSAVKAAADAANSESEVEAFTQELHENTTALQRLGDSMNAIHEATEATKKEVKDDMERVSYAVKKYEEKTNEDLKTQKRLCVNELENFVTTLREMGLQCRLSTRKALKAHSIREKNILDGVETRLTKLLTIVIPPETYEMQKQVFDTYIKMFNEDLSATVKTRLDNAKEDYNRMHSDLSKLGKRLANVGSRVAVPATLFYCCFVTLLLSLLFLVMAIWNIDTEDYGLKIANLAVKFGWITGIANTAIIAYSIWYHRH